MSYSPKSQARYKAAHTRHFGITLNDRTDADLIAALDAAPAKQTLIKQALRDYLVTHCNQLKMERQKEESK